MEGHAILAILLAQRAPAFAKLAALVRRSQTDPTSGADELAFAHNRTYDDARLRAALGASYRPSPTLGAEDVARFVAAFSAR